MAGLSEGGKALEQCTAVSEWPRTDVILLQQAEAKPLNELRAWVHLGKVIGRCPFAPVITAVLTHPAPEGQERQILFPRYTHRHLCAHPWAAAGSAQHHSTQQAPAVQRGLWIPVLFAWRLPREWEQGFVPTSTYLDSVRCHPPPAALTTETQSTAHAQQELG